MAARQVHVTTKLTEEETFKLVRLYHKEECLWDVRNPDYKNQAKRAVAHESILKAMGKKNFGTTELKHKIKNLRCTYNQEYAKIQKSANTDSPYVPNVKWYGTMDAIYTKLKWEAPQHVGDVLNFLWPVKTEEEFVMEEDARDPLEVNHQDCDSIEAGRQEQYTQHLRGKKRTQDYLSNQIPKVPKLDNTLAEYENYCQTASSSAQFLDQYDKFGLHIAAQLRELPLWNFIVLQEKIQCLITSERLSCLEPPKTPPQSSPNVHGNNSTC